MIPLTYTQTVGQEHTLRHIETLRAKLLCVVIPTHTERSLYWKSVIETIQAAFSSAEEQISTEKIERAIESRRPKSHELEIVLIWNAIQHVRENFSGNAGYLSTDSIKTLFSLPGKNGTQRKTNVDLFLKNIQPALSYLAAGHEHPVIQAAILMAIVFHFEIPKDELYQYASLATYAVLTTHGYTCRDLYSPISTLLSDADSLTKAIQSITITGNLNHWILYVTSRIELSLTDALESISHSSPAVRAHSKKYMTLTDRQKTILRLLEKPGITVHNAFIQRRFGVSQLTASRDLMQLTKLGLISPHGKSRSTSYTRIG